MDISLSWMKYHNLGLSISFLLLTMSFQSNQAQSVFPSSTTIRQEIGNDIQINCSYNLKAGDKLSVSVNEKLYSIVLMPNLDNPQFIEFNTHPQFEVTTEPGEIQATDPPRRFYEITLTVRNPSFDNAGDYNCELREEGNTVRVAATTIIIVGPPRNITLSSTTLPADSFEITRRMTVPDESAFDFTSIVFDVTTNVNQGHILDLEAEVTAVPDAQYRWIAANVEHHGILSLTKDKNMSKVVYVVATNDYGTLNASINVIAHYKPEIEPLITRHYPGHGEKLTIDCVVNAVPSARMFFIKVDEETGEWQRLAEKLHIRELGGTGVEIERVDLSRDVGKYLCIAENIYGNDSAEFFIDGTPIDTKLVINDIYGDSAELTIETRSSMETAFTVFINNTLKDGNLHSYQEDVMSHSSGSRLIQKNLPLENLKPETEYHVTVYATNQFGQSESVTVDFTTRQEGVTKPPVSIEVTQKLTNDDGESAAAGLTSALTLITFAFNTFIF